MDDLADLADLDRALGALRHDRHGYFGALGRDLMLRSIAEAPDPAARTYRVLRFVEAQPPGTVTIGQVGELLLCDMARASRVVHRMVDDGLLTLRVGSGDARQRRLGLAPRGLDVVAAAATRRRDHLARAVRDWSPEDVRTLARLLDRLTAAPLTGA